MSTASARKRASRGVDISATSATFTRWADLVRTGDTVTPRYRYCRSYRLTKASARRLSRLLSRAAQSGRAYCTFGDTWWLPDYARNR